MNITVKNYLNKEKIWNKKDFNLKKYKNVDEFVKDIEETIKNSKGEIEEFHIAKDKNDLFAVMTRCITPAYLITFKYIGDPVPKEYMATNGEGTIEDAINRTRKNYGDVEIIEVKKL